MQNLWRDAVITASLYMLLFPSSLCLIIIFKLEEIAGDRVFEISSEASGRLPNWIGKLDSNGYLK